MIEDFERCYRAVRSRDPRFDGWFYTAVTSTHIYCRPSCPAITPLRKNVRFFPSSAAAQLSGFRACKRCRPDASPGSPEWNARADVAARAMRLIGDGLVDRRGVVGLASRLGYSVRQLERLLRAEIGAGPIAIARAQRAQTARILIETTALAMSDVAFAAGFSSVRQFNDTVRAIFAASPSELRTRTRHSLATAPAAIDLRLPFRQPLQPDNLFGQLAAMAVPGVEEVIGTTYRRTLRLEHGPGVVELTPTPNYISCRASLSDLRDLTSAIARCRWLLDLDADPVAIDELLCQDRRLRRVISPHPGRRVRRCVDGAEMALRTVLGQQISIEAARTITGRLVASHGEPISDPSGGLTHLFPEPEALREAVVAMPVTRRRTFATLVDALSDGRLDLGPGSDRAETEATLDGLGGVGPWTKSLIAMRALGDPDAFPVTDLGTKRAAEGLGLPPTPAALSARSAPWQPWRAYATQYLWSTLTHRLNVWPVLPTTDRSTTSTGAHP